MIVQVLQKPMKTPNIIRSRECTKNTVLLIKGILELDTSNAINDRFNYFKFLNLSYNYITEFERTAKFYILYCNRGFKIRNIILYRVNEC